VIDQFVIVYVKPMQFFIGKGLPKDNVGASFVINRGAVHPVHIPHHVFADDILRSADVVNDI